METVDLGFTCHAPVIKVTTGLGEHDFQDDSKGVLRLCPKGETEVGSQGREL